MEKNDYESAGGYSSVHCTFDHFLVKLQADLAGLGLKSLRPCLFQLRRPNRYRVTRSLWCVENQWLMNTGEMAEQALDCKSKDGGSATFLPSPVMNNLANCKSKAAVSVLPGLLPTRSIL